MTIHATGSMHAGEGIRELVEKPLNPKELAKDGHAAVCDDPCEREV